ncbi:MAG: hypothetical protein ACRD3W_20330, partial [Terriglobales bacterium]
ARNTITFDHAAPLSLTANFISCGKPSMFRFFRADELHDLQLRDQPDVSDDTLLYLDHLTGLKMINLCGTEVSDKGLAHIAALPDLLEVNVIRCPITGTGLAKMKCIPTLEILKANGVQNITPVLTRLSGSHNLRIIAVKNCNVTDRGLALLSRCPELIALEVGPDKQITNAGIAKLLACKYMRELSIVGCNVTPAVVDILKQCQNLKRLKIDMSTWPDKDKERLLFELPSAIVNPPDKQG